MRIWAYILQEALYFTFVSGLWVNIIYEEQACSLFVFGFIAIVSRSRYTRHRWDGRKAPTLRIELQYKHSAYLGCYKGEIPFDNRSSVSIFYQIIGNGPLIYLVNGSLDLSTPRRQLYIKLREELLVYTVPIEFMQRRDIAKVDWNICSSQYPHAEGEYHLSFWLWRSLPLSVRLHFVLLRWSVPRAGDSSA